MSAFQAASADIQRLQAPSNLSQQETPHSLQPLSDRELSKVSDQGPDDVLQGLFMRAESGDGLSTISQLAKLVMPILSSLEAETSLKDMRYDIDKMSSAINPDGSLNLRLPSSIGELRFDNVRAAGAPRGQSFGSLSLHDIDLSQASLKVRLRQ